GRAGGRHRAPRLRRGGAAPRTRAGRRHAGAGLPGSDRRRDRVHRTAPGGLTMRFAPVLHAEWLKIRTVRSLPGALLALFAVTTAFSAVAGADNASDPEPDLLFTALSGAAPGQI